MSVGIRIKVDHRAFHEAEAKFMKASQRAIQNIVAYGVAQAKKNAPRKTGTLQRSITPIQVTGNGGRYGTALIYARIQEEGGVIKPKKAKVLRFKIGNRWVSAKQVRIKGKHYLKRSAEATQKAVPQLVRKAIRESGL